MLNKINDYFDKVKNCIDNVDRNEIKKFIDILSDAKVNGMQIFIMGNGGSAASASHFCCDFNKGVSYQKDNKFKMICLNDNIATVMAYANDVGYEDVFVEQLKNFLRKGDIVIGLSGSGNSKNILKAVEYANANGAITVGLTGYDGGMLKKIASYSVNANIDDMQVSEDMHMMLIHMLMQIFMEE